MLRNVLNEKLFECRGVLAFYKAQSVGDDIKLYDEDDKCLGTLHGLRQQVFKCIYIYLYINLRRSRDGAFVRSVSRPSCVRVEFGFIHFVLTSFYADCPHKRIM